MGENAPKVKIELDKVRHMQFTFGVAKKFKDLTGKSLTDVTADNMTFEEVAALLYLTLQVEDKELTQEQADDLFQFGHMRIYSAALMDLMEQSNPDGEAPKVPESPTISASGLTEDSASD